MVAIFNILKGILCAFALGTCIYEILYKLNDISLLPCILYVDDTCRRRFITQSLSQSKTVAILL